MPLVILAAVLGVAMLSALAAHLLVVLEILIRLDVVMAAQAAHLTMATTEAQAVSLVVVVAVVAAVLQAHTSAV